MLVYALSLLLFGFWTAVGRAVVEALNPRIGILRSWLLAPSVGLAAVVLGLMVGNQAGLPIGVFAWPLTAGLGALALGVLAWRRPVLPARPLAPYLLAGLLFLAWAGWPVLRFGFTWLSYVNQDYVNYCLAAQRFRDFGFYRPPTLDELGGRDYSQFFWFMHVSALMRFGSEHVLAWLSALTRKHPLTIFMPMILALGMTQMAAAAALILHNGRWRRLSRWSAALLALSPLFMMGCLYQLIAQVGGLALMMTTLALMTARLGRRRRGLIGPAALAAVPGAALCVFYPEVAPFALLAAGLFFCVEWAGTRAFPGSRIVLFEYALFGLAVLLRHNLVSALYTLALQFSSSTEKIDVSLSMFPFFLIPTGLAGLFGFVSENGAPPEPLASLLILGGAGLLLAAFAAALRLTGRRLPFACLLLVELALGFKLFRGGSDFGLFKLAMFIQPVLVAAVAWLILSIPRTRWRAAAALGFVGLTIPTALQYTRASAGDSAGGFIELRGASRLIRELPPAPPPGTHWGSGIENVVAAEIAAGLYRGTEIKFLSRDFFETRAYYDTSWPMLRWFPHSELFGVAHDLLEARADRFIANRTLFDSRFVVVRELDPPTSYLSLSPQLSLFNKLHPAPSDGRSLFTAEGDLRNRLVFVHSSRGNHYYSNHYSLENRRTIAFFQQEADFFNPGGAFSGLGRFMLLRVEHPADSLYLQLSLSSSVMGRGRTALPAQATVAGSTAVPLGLVGNGAARRIVGPVVPVTLDGSSYVAIDFQQAPSPFPYERTGLSALYNRNVPLDFRWLVAYGRDISALTRSEVDALKRPRGISRFPADLLDDSALEFSGIYEDGWISPRSEVVLAESRPGELVRLKGYVPPLPGNGPEGAMRVSINGDAPVRLSAASGTRFDWLLPIAAASRTTRVEIQFDAPALLPGGDDRPVGGMLERLELVPGPEGKADYSTAGGLRPAAEGVDQDGWAESVAMLELPGPASARSVELVIDFPGWSGAPAAPELRLSVDGGAAQSRALKAGRNTLTLPADAGPMIHRVRIEASSSVRLPPPDTRTRAYRLISAQSIPTVSR